MSDKNFEQWCAISFCFRHRHSSMETYITLVGLQTQYITKDPVFWWFNAFSERRESIRHFNLSKAKKKVRMSKTITKRMLDSFSKFSENFSANVLIYNLALRYKLLVNYSLKKKIGMHIIFDFLFFIIYSQINFK